MERKSIIRRTAIVGVLTGFLLSMMSATAQAADAYRYWTYWWGTDGGWEFAQTGPADRQLEQGSIEGWLFQSSAEDIPTVDPAENPSFDLLCGEPGQPTAGEIQVAVVIDYGVALDAPDGETPPEGPVVECLSLPAGSTGQDALAAAAEIRVENGATCGINGYPATGCFELVTTQQEPVAIGAEEPSAEEPVDTGDRTALWLTLAGVLAVGVIIAVTLARSRGNGSGKDGEDPAA